MMKKLWIMLLCAMVLMTTVACGVSKPADTKAEDKQEAKEDDTEYEKFNQLGLTFLLPEGTTEEEAEAEYTYYYRNGDLYIMLQYDDDYQLKKSEIKAYADSVAEGFEDAELGEIKACKVDGHEGYQFDVSGEIGGVDMITTLTIFNVGEGHMSFFVSNQSLDKEDYETINEKLIDSIKVDDSVFEEAATPDYYVKGDTAVTEDCTIKITGHKVLKPGQGDNAYGKDYVIVFEYDLTNTSGAKMTAAVEWPIIVDVIQDNDPNAVNELQTAFIDNSNAQAQLQEIKAGGTVHCKDAYTLTDTKTPVTLKFTNGMMGEELGTMTFEIK